MKAVYNYLLCRCILELVTFFHWPRPIYNFPTSTAKKKKKLHFVLFITVGKLVPTAVSAPVKIIVLAWIHRIRHPFLSRQRNEIIHSVKYAHTTIAKTNQPLRLVCYFCRFAIIKSFEKKCRARFSEQSVQTCAGTHLKRTMRTR